MKVGEALRAAAASRALHGVRPRAFGQRAWIGFYLVGLGGAFVLALVGSAFAAPIGILTFFGGLAPLAWIRRSTIEHNEAAEAMSRGLLDEAERRWVHFFRRPRFDQIAALALHQLGTIELRRGRFGDATPLYRAAFALEKARLFASAGSLAATARANLVMALVAGGNVDEARETLAAPEPAGAYPAARAALASSRALLALRTNDPAGALHILETNRRVMQNVLTGNDAALAEVLEAASLSALAATPEGAPRAVHPVPVDAEARAFVTRLLPECEPLLLDDVG